MSQLFQEFDPQKLVSLESKLSDVLNRIRDFERCATSHIWMATYADEGDAVSVAIDAIKALAREAHRQNLITWYPRS
jgi:hypothetical protein